MNKLKTRIFNIPDFSDPEYARLVLDEQESIYPRNKKLSLISMLLYFIAIILALIPIIINISNQTISGLINFMLPILYISSLTITVVFAYKTIFTIVSAFFSIGMDIELPTFDIIIGALLSVLAIGIMFVFPPFVSATHIIRESELIKRAENVA